MEFLIRICGGGQSGVFGNLDFPLRKAYDLSQVSSKGDYVVYSLRGSVWQSGGAGAKKYTKRLPDKAAALENGKSLL